MAGRPRAGSRPPRERARRLLPAALHVRHHRLPEGRDADPPQHARPLGERGGGRGPRTRGRPAGRDAALPRRRHELRADRALVRGDAQGAAHARSGRGAGHAGARRHHPHVPRACAAGGDDAGARGRRAHVPHTARRLLRGLAHAAPGAAGLPEGLPRADGAGVRDDRGVRRRHGAAGARPRRPRRRAPAGLGGHPDPGGGDRDPRPGHRRAGGDRRAGRDLRAHRTADERLLGQAGGHRGRRSRPRAGCAPATAATSTPTATST